MPGGAKDFFFSAAPVQTATEADETPEPAAVNQVNDTEAPEQNFFNPGTTETDAETEPPPAAFFNRGGRGYPDVAALGTGFEIEVEDVVTTQYGDASARRRQVAVAWRSLSIAGW